MKRLYGKDNFNWWIGVVENRNDPEQLGRCKVRIYGYHSINKTILPTKDLPWAIPIQPITSAASSGKGSAPLGPLPGTWVVGWFLDSDDMQQPAFFGTIGTKAAEITFFSTPNNPVASNPAPPPIVKNTNDSKQKDSDGNVMFDQNKLPLVKGFSFSNPPTSSNKPAITYKLGSTSKKYESADGGPGTINNYKESFDLGGASYGTYQFASFFPRTFPDGNPRPSPANSPLLAFLKTSRFGYNFYNSKKKIYKLEPGTDAFDSKWKGIARTFNKEFEEQQYKFVKRNYYDAMLTNLKAEGLDFTLFSGGVKNLIWSTSVQLGPERTFVFTEPLKDRAELTDKDVVELVSEFKIAKVDELFKSSPKEIRDSIRERYKAEKQDLLKLIPV